MKRIGIVGSRRRNSEEDYRLLEKKFLEIYENGDELVSGGCPKGWQPLTLNLQNSTNT